MGMYDTFVGEIDCLMCGGVAEINEQTKKFDCLLKDITIGDYIDKADKDYSLPVECFCKICGNSFISYAVIKSGQLVEYSHTKSGIQTQSNYNTAKIVIRGDRDHPFIKAYMDLPQDQRNLINNALTITLFDGYSFEVFEDED